MTQLFYYTVSVFSSKKYVLTLVPIFVVCPALAFILWLTRHRIARWLPCCKKAAAAALADKDGAKVEDANGEFFQVVTKAQIKHFCSLGRHPGRPPVLPNNINLW